ncbi:MAG TPA: maleate cis-trans isomerase [Arthrobacter sp.]|nr:maleate cis-trans isomerase [Arthrobacter sp.]
MTRVPTIGLLYPGVGAEDDFPRLEQRLAGQLRLPVVTTAGGDVLHTVDTLLSVGSSANLLDGARRAAAFQPDAVMWACTSGSFVYGWAGAQEQARRIGEDLGLPASSTSLAFAHAVKQLGLSRVAIAASYPEDLARHFRRFLADASIDVVHLGSSGIATAGEVGLMGLEEITRMAVAADRPEAEAVLIPDTAMHSLAWLDELEDAVGKPVLTANQVTVWEGLRIAGLLRNFSGLGSLFRSTEAIRIPAGS